MLKKLLRREPPNLVDASRQLGGYVVEKEGYPFAP